MTDTSLIFNILARDKTSKVFAKMRASAMSTGSIIKTALGPSIAPVVATSSAAVVGLGAALLGAGAAAGVFAAVTATAFTEVQEASQKSADLVDKIALLEERIRVANATGVGNVKTLEKARANALNELMARYAQMPPALQKVTGAYDDMKLAWERFVNKNKPATYGIMTAGFNAITSIIPKLQPLFDVGADAAGRLVKALTKASEGGGIDRFVAWLTAQAGPALNNLGTIGKNFGVILGNLFDTFDEKGQGILQWLADASTRWAEWSNQTGGEGMSKMLDYFNQHGPAVVDLLRQLVGAAVTIAQATAPLAPISLAIASGLAGIIAAMPPGVLTALIASWVAYSVAMKAVGVVQALIPPKIVRTKIALVAKTVAIKAATLATRAWGIATATAAATARGAALATTALAGAINRQAIASKLAAAWAAIIRVATATWTAVQWLLNVAMMANPLGLIIAAIIALIAIIVLIATKTTWFQDLWNAIWSKIGDPVKAVWNWIKANWPLLLGIITGPIGWIVTVIVKNWDTIKSATVAVANWITSKFLGVVNWFKGLPGRISSATKSMFNGLVSAFRNSVNSLIRIWNNFSLTLGGGSVLGMGIPSVTLRTPNLPYLESGGTIRRGGSAVVADRQGRGGEVVSLPRGAQVTPLRGGHGGGRVEVVIKPGAERWVHELIRRFVEFKGGNVQTAYGSGRG